MVFPTGWGRRAALTIDNTQVSGSGDHTNMPILWTVANLPSEMFDADGSFPALAGGGDIRFTSDEAGTTLLSIDVVFFTIDNNPANGTAEIWCKVPTVDFNDDTVIYVWYDKSGETQPAASTDPGGSEAVWADYVFVTHLEDATPIDATGNATITVSGSPSTVTGPSGLGGLNFDGSTDKLQIPDAANLDITTVTMQTIVNADAMTSNFATMIRRQNSYYMGFKSDGDFEVTTWKSSGTHEFKDNGNWSASTDFWMSGGWDGDFDHRYVDGVVSASFDIADGTLNSASDALQVAGRSTGEFFDGDIYEARVRDGWLGADWIKTEYDNQSAPGTFASAGTPETPSAPTASLLLMQQSFRQAA